ncbi:MAG: hypothetical protein GC200_08260 [Tepidisphaera sp.]|nr:hypothetical protein [Tepidisphaera sp.]
MAKKAKKAAKKAPAKKAAKKAPAKKAPAKKAAGKPAKKTGGGKGPATGMAPVSTGSGANPLQVGKTLVAMFNQGKLKEIEDFYWTPDIVSCEGFGVNAEWRGRAAVHEKNSDWMKDHKLHGATAEGPFVGSTGFAVKFKMDVETVSTGKREMMEEIGVYTIRDGKICREEFMYAIGAG